MTRPAKPKPQAHEEVARVLNVYYMLLEEVIHRVETGPEKLRGIVLNPDAILAVAERIAARTEG